MDPDLTPGVSDISVGGLPQSSCTDQVPLVSVVTPTLNQAAFVRHTIESVLSQDYRNIEHWIIDGGSTDGTLNILKEYSHDRRLCWISEPDRCHANAVSKGLALARGEIIGWLNSDDTYCPGALSAQVRYLLRHPEVDVVYGDCLFTDENGKGLEYVPGRPFQLLELLRFSTPHQPTVFLRREAAQKAGPLDESFYFAMDSEYWLRLHSLGFRFAYNPGLVATYRLHPRSKTGSQHEKAYPDWLRLVGMYSPPKYRSRALADVRLAIAIDALRRGAVRKSLKEAGAAVLIRPTPRLGLYVAHCLDRWLGTSLYSFLTTRMTRKLAGAAPESAQRSRPRPLFAMVSTAIRRDLVHPISQFSRLEVRHFYRTISPNDLAVDELADTSLQPYATALDLLGRLWRCRPDIIQGVEPFAVRLLPSLYAVYLVSLLRRVPLVLVTLENRPLEQKYGKALAVFLKTALKPVFRRAAAVIVLNEGARRNVLKVGPYSAKLHRLMYGTWGIDPVEFQPEGSRQHLPLTGGPVLLFVGRLQAEKGVFDLLEAFARIREQFPQAVLVLVGDGPERKTLEQEIRRRGLEWQVTLTGVVFNRDLPPYFRSADVFVAPSITTPRWEEQVGMSILQAMASGVPVVATRSGAIPEYLPETAGILVPEHDPGALAQAVLTLLHDADLGRRLGQAGRELSVKRYDARENVREAERLILQIHRTSDPRLTKVGA